MPKVGGLGPHLSSRELNRTFRANTAWRQSSMNNVSDILWADLHNHNEIGYGKGTLQRSYCSSPEAPSDRALHQPVESNLLTP